PDQVWCDPSWRLCGISGISTGAPHRQIGRFRVTVRLGSWRRWRYPATPRRGSARLFFAGGGSHRNRDSEGRSADAIGIGPVPTGGTVWDGSPYFPIILSVTAR